MACGRGTLFKRLSQLTTNEPEESPKPETPVPRIINGCYPQGYQGRRKLFARLGLEPPLELGNSKDVVCQKIPTTLSQIQSTDPQQQPIIFESPPEEKAPVICKVPKISEKSTYCMNELLTNYIKIELEENKSVYEYKITFDPLVDSRSAQFYLINRCKEFPVKNFNGNLLFVPYRLPQNKTIITGELKDGSQIQMTVIYKRKKYTSECTEFYCILLRSIMKSLNFVEFGRYFFDQEKMIEIPEYKLEIWSGYIITVDEFENGFYMCCDVSHRILFKETVLQTIQKILTNSANNGKDFKNEIMAVLCNKVIITRYNNKTYRVDDVDFSMTPLSTFKYHDSDISFVDYFKKRNIEIKDLKQPMLITNPKRKNLLNNRVLEDTDLCCLVPELCNLTGLTENMKNDFKLMKVLNNATLLEPEKRRKALIDLINTINDNELAKNKLQNWGIKLCPIPVKIEAPVYKQETILLGQNVRKQIGFNMNWGMDVVKNPMFRASNISNWAILYNSNDVSTAKSFCNQLSLCGKPLGMDISVPQKIPINRINTEDFVSTINRVVKCNPELQLVVIIFPNIREDRYNAVKRLCCAEIGIPSQVIISRTLSKPDRLRSITQKIALQINCKLGGACWSIDIPLGNTMVVGIDIYHEKAKQSNSVIGIVASLDKTFTQWCSVPIIQKNTQQEIIECLPIAFHKALTIYKEKNGKLPERIIIYRDGISDGEILSVKEFELRSLENSFKNYPGNYSPMITFIIVRKRINTRIFQLINEEYSNPKPGTVVDNTITKKNVFDFFLVSQFVRQGTVSPTHYIVLHNGCNLSPEQLQRLSYKLCHFYYNWTGTTKIPAPVQYAHKLAYLIGQNIRQMPNNKLTETLFFL